MTRSRSEMGYARVAKGNRFAMGRVRVVGDNEFGMGNVRVTVKGREIERGRCVLCQTLDTLNTGHFGANGSIRPSHCWMVHVVGYNEFGMVDVRVTVKSHEIERGRCVLYQTLELKTGHFGVNERRIRPSHYWDNEFGMGRVRATAKGHEIERGRCVLYQTLELNTGHLGANGGRIHPSHYWVAHAVEVPQMNSPHPTKRPRYRAAGAKSEDALSS
jgi:hypothetical protein